MPTRPKKKPPPPERVYEANQQPKQAHFTPPNQTISRKSHPRSTTKSKQQTLTQIDFVLRATPRDENSDLQYLEEEERPEERSRERKRRKIVHGETLGKPKHDDSSISHVQTRSAKRRAMKEEELNKEARIQKNISSPHRGTNLTSVVCDEALMPPPKTPFTIRRTEVPCSVSPMATPLSTRSRRARNSVSRSPLKEKSMNIGNPQYLESKPIGFPQKPRLEVRDTFDSENWGSQISDHLSSSAINPNFFSQAPRQPSEDLTTSGSSEEQVPTETVLEYGGSPRIDQATQTLTLEIADSEEDEGDDDMVDHDESDDRMIETRVNSFVAESFPDSLNGLEHTPSAKFTCRAPHSHESSIRPDSPLVFKEVKDTTGSKKEFKAPRAGQHIVEASDDSPPRTSLTSQALPDPISTTQTEQTPPPHLFSGSRQASAQLNTDLRCLTQLQHFIPTIESDSQFENGFRNFSPSHLIQDSEDEGEEEDKDEEENEDEKGMKVNPESEPEAEEEESPCPSKSCLNIPSLPPLDLPPTVQVPSSQATTVDLTQLPPSARLSHSSQNMRSRPAFAIPSSPLNDIRSSQIETAWDGKHLTDSQLLPESLMNDSLRPAPCWREENEEDDEEEEEG